MTYRVEKVEGMAGLPLSGLFLQYLDFYGEVADREAAAEFFKARVRNGESLVYAAWSDREAVGFVQIYPSYSSVLLGRVYILNDLFVSPAHRRRGVGRALLRASIDAARNGGARRLTLATAVGNAEAQALYSKMGLSRDEKFYRYSLELAAPFL